MYSFDEISLENLDIEEYYDFPDKSVFTTIPWINYLKEDVPEGKLIFLRIMSEGRFIGYFTGMQIKKYGIKIVGSPFRGWSTCFMGLDVISGADRGEIIRELKTFLFQRYKCQYIDITDRNLSEVEEEFIQGKVTKIETLELKIDKTDEELFKGFKTDCRNFIRQFERKGASIEIAEPDEKFAHEFYDQLTDVFKKQGMVPTYSEEKVERLIRCLGEKDMVLCLRVRDPEGNSIASSIYPGYGEKCFFWGGASYRKTQFYRPNEYMIWTAIKYWRDRGATVMDMIGVRDYKKKFRPEVVVYNQLEFATSAILISAKNFAEKAYFYGLHVKERFRRKKES